MKASTSYIDVYSNLTIEENLLSSQRLIDLCPKDCAQFVIITDNNVKTLYATPLQKHLEQNNLKTHLISVPSGEVSKTRETVSAIQDELLDLGYGRDTCILALGGGVITDLAGFIAATYCRGIPAIYLPTTLLAMVDAALGGKTGVNTRHGKNLIGVFSQPREILSDINTLKTLPKDEYLCAFSEIIKHALIFNKDYFDELFANADKLKNRDMTLLKSIIRKSCYIKSRIVEQDEKEQGIRAICNAGHTIGHAIELACDYTINHGKAVAIGIIVEAYIAMQMRILSSENFLKIKEIILSFEIPLSLEKKLDIRELKKALILDKKSRAKIPQFVLLQGIGETHVNDSKYTTPVDELVLEKALNYLINEITE